MSPDLSQSGVGGCVERQQSLAQLLALVFRFYLYLFNISRAPLIAHLTVLPRAGRLIMDESPNRFICALVNSH